MNTGIGKSNGRTYRLEVSNYDRTASLFLSLVMLLGIAVFLLLILWLAGKAYPTDSPPPPVWRTEFRDPEVKEDPVIVPPKGDETDLQTTPVHVVLKEVGKEAIKTWGTRDGDWPPRLPPEDEREELPPPEPCWEFRLPEGLTLEAYTRLLDSFNIELGVVLPGGKICYASHLAKRKPDTRLGPVAAEQRMYLTWCKGDQQEADRVLLRHAGIDPSGRLILRFVPPELEAELQRLAEQKKEMDQRPSTDVERTLFGVRSAGSQGFEFFVMEQSYR